MNFAIWGRDVRDCYLAWEAVHAKPAPCPLKRLRKRAPPFATGAKFRE